MTTLPSTQANHIGSASGASPSRVTHRMPRGAAFR